MKKDFEKLTNEIIDSIEQGNFGKWISPYLGGIAFPKNILTDQYYNGFNILALWYAAFENGYKSLQYMTFKQAKAYGERIEHDVHVRKGEHGHKVIRYVTWIPKEYQGKPDAEDHAHATMKVFTVFNYDQFEGLPPLEYKDKADWKISHNELMAFRKSWPVEIKERESVPCYIPNKDEIHMLPPELVKTEDDYWSTLTHEMIHSTGHKSRLDRFKKGAGKGSKEYAFEELIAEFGSLFLCAHFNVKNPQARHVDYLAAYASMLRENHKLLISASSMAYKAYEWALDAVKSTDKVEANG